MTRLVLLCALGLSSCGPDDGPTIYGRALDACLQAIPACPGLHAACVLDPSRYAEVHFPGSFSFMVEAEAEDEIEVVVYLITPKDAGRSTQIFWNEPGCSEVYVYDSEGRDMFLEAEDEGAIIKRQAVKEDGEHLVELFSDMQADTLVTINLIEANPGQD